MLAKGYSQGSVVGSVVGSVRKSEVDTTLMVVFSPMRDLKNIHGQNCSFTVKPGSRIGCSGIWVKG